MRLDLSDLRLFLCIVDAGSITQGALRANLALASASERLRGMEADLGLKLLERRSRGVATTEAGEALAHHARLILRQQALLKGELRDFALGARGTIHLYANTAALTVFLPRTLGPWLAARPGLRVELKERTSVEIIRMLHAGLAEAGIVSDAVDANGLVRQAIAKDHLALIVPRTHRLAECAAVRFIDILDEAFVGLTSRNALQEHIEAHARAEGRNLAMRVHMKTFEGVCGMVSDGAGVAILPRSLAGRYRRKNGYRTIPLAEKWARRQLCLCFRDWNELSPPIQSLLVHLGAKSQAPAAGLMPEWGQTPYGV